MSHALAVIVPREGPRLRAGKHPSSFGRGEHRQGQNGLATAAVLGLVWLGLVTVAGAANGSHARDRAEADALFTNGTLLRLALEISPAQLSSLRNDPRQYVPATLREGTTTYSNIAVHLKGGIGSFRPVDDQPGFTLSLNHFDETVPRFHGLKKFHLNNSVQDPSRLSEWVAGEVFRKAGVPAARVTHALVELNGRKLGLYLILEAMDKDFLSLSFTNANGNLYGQTPRGDVTDSLERMEGKGPVTRADLQALAKALQEPNAGQRRVRIEALLDVNRFLSFMALEVIFGHRDGYTFSRHNFRLYHDPDTDRLVFMPHDLDQLMQNPASELLPRGGGLVAQAVMQTPELRARYRQRVGELATNLFHVSELTNRVDQLTARLVPALAVNDPTLAWRLTNFGASFKNRIVSRGIGLEQQLAALSGARPPRFRGDVAPLAEWWPDTQFRRGRLEQVKDRDGKLTLWLGASGRAVGWHTLVLLEPGRYRFEGLARCADLESSALRRNARAYLTGASLAVPDHRQIGESALSGDSPWRKLSAEFEVTVREEVELVCQLQARQGQAWFDRSSLQLVRLR